MVWALNDINTITPFYIYKNENLGLKIGSYSNLETCLKQVLFFLSCPYTDHCTYTTIVYFLFWAKHDLPHLFLNAFFGFSILLLLPSVSLHACQQACFCLMQQTGILMPSQVQRKGGGRASSVIKGKRRTK